SLEQRVERAVLDRNAAFLESVYGSSFRFKHASGKLETRDQRMQSLRAELRAGARRETARDLDSLEVEVHGDIALTTGRVHVRRDGPPMPNRDYTIRYARIYTRAPQPGGWQLLTHHSTQQTSDAPRP